MKIIKKNCFDICFNEESKKARILAKLIAECRLPYAIDWFERTVIVVGGDGTMLEATHHYNFEGIFLGVNCGHKGALMNDADDAVNRLISQDLDIHEFPLLDIRSGKNWNDLGLEVYFNRITGRACKVKVVVDGAVVSERIAGDGIDIATALSTGGYFVPICGTAVHAQLPVICFAPIVRNTPFQITPMILPITSVLEVTLLSPPEEVRGWCDAIDIPYFKKITVKKADRTFKLAFWKRENFSKRLIEKIMKV